MPDSQQPMAIQIRAAQPAEWPRALRLVFQNLRPDLQQRQSEAILIELRAQPEAAAGLLTAWSGELLAAATLIQLQPGRVANLWPPQLATERSADAGSAARQLLTAATELAVRAGTRMIQALLPTDSGPDAERLRAAGFEHDADLLYLVSPASAFPSTCPDDPFEYERYSSSSANRFSAVVERTYVGTRDCPRLNGVRPIQEVLEGYRAVGRFDPALWRLVRYQRNDVGCLLLVEHPPHKLWEVVYMGIVPEARGRGFGLAITRHAQWLASKAGAERLVLAVDAANEPAIKAYAAAGFTTWDRRSVFLKILT
jgi:ribosomal protein S18 acetylase RimI-like enzyme